MSTVQSPAESVVKAPELSRRRWGIILILLLAAVVNYLDRANLSIANTTISQEFGFSATQMGLLLSAFLWPYALANLPAGWLVDRFGPKKMFTGALGMWSAVTFLMGFVNTYSFFYGLRMLLGLRNHRSSPPALKLPRAGSRKKSVVCLLLSSTPVRKLRMRLHRRC
jgi:sugar phosphate permease